MKSENALRARGNTYSNHRLRSKRVWGSWLTSDLKWNWFSNFPANGILYECIPHKDLYGVYSTLVIKHASFGILYVDYYWIYFLLIGAGNEDRLVSRILMYEPNKRLLSKKGLCSCTSCIPTIIVSYQLLENYSRGPFVKWLQHAYLILNWTWINCFFCTWMFSSIVLGYSAL